MLEPGHLVRAHVYLFECVEELAVVLRGFERDDFLLIEIVEVVNCLRRWHRGSV